MKVVYTNGGPVCRYTHGSNENINNGLNFPIQLV